MDPKNCLSLLIKKWNVVLV